MLPADCRSAPSDLLHVQVCLCGGSEITEMKLIENEAAEGQAAGAIAAHQAENRIDLDGELHAVMERMRRGKKKPTKDEIYMFNSKVK